MGHVFADYESRGTLNAGMTGFYSRNVMLRVRYAIHNGTFERIFKTYGDQWLN